VTTDVGDIRSMVAAENRPFIIAPGDETGFASALAQLAADAQLRAAIGAANRARAIADYDEAVMIERYRSLYRIG
jgi:L-malate glycosyltransferase